MSTYKKTAAVLEAYRRGRFFYQASEDTPSRYELYVSGSDLMEGRLTRHMPRDSNLYGSAMECPVFPLLDTLQKHKAVAFSENPVIEVVDANTHHALTSNDLPVLRHLTSILNSTGVLGALAQADSYLVTHRSAVVTVRLTPQGRVRVSTLPPYCVDIVPDPHDPGSVEYAPRVVVPLLGDMKPEPVESDLRLVYQRTPRGWFGGVVDYRGESVDMEIPGAAANGALQVQGHPVVVWKDRDCDTPLAPLPKYLQNAQEKLNLLLAEVQHAFRAGAHGQPYLERTEAAHPFEVGDAGRIIGSDDDGETALKIGESSITLDGGVTAVPTIPPGWSLKLQQAKVDPLAQMRYVESHIKLAYASEDLIVSRIDLFNPQPANYSGAAKMIDASPLEDAKQRRELRLARYAQATLEMFKQHWNLVCDPKDRFPDNTYFRVRFPGLYSPTIFTRQESVQALQMAAELGAINIADDVLAPMRKISREEARKLVAQNAGFFGRMRLFSTRDEP